mgnify:CR=1 FL=1
MNKKGEIDLNKLPAFLIKNEDIKLVYPEKVFKKNSDTDKVETGLKIYFYHKKQ